MYAYFIDDWVYGRKHHRWLDKIDLLLTQKGISGRKIKLGRLHDLSESIKDCASFGVKTFVAVGNDSTASRVLNSMLKDKDFSFTFAVVPVHRPNAIANVFGYQTIQQASDALAANRTANIDLGLLNSRHYFVTSAVFPKKCSFGFCSYTVSSLFRDHHISVCNSNIYNGRKMADVEKFSITDGILEAVIAHRPPVSFFGHIFGKNSKTNYFPESIFQVKSISIKSKQKTIAVNADTEKQLTAPVMTEVAPRALQIIIGDEFYGRLQN